MLFTREAQQIIVQDRPSTLTVADYQHDDSRSIGQLIPTLESAVDEGRIISGSAWLRTEYCIWGAFLMVTKNLIVWQPMKIAIFVDQILNVGTDKDDWPITTFSASDAAEKKLEKNLSLIKSDHIVVTVSM